MKEKRTPVAIYSTGGIFGFTQQRERLPAPRFRRCRTHGHDKTTQETPILRATAYTYDDGK